MGNILNKIPFLNDLDLNPLHNTDLIVMMLLPFVVFSMPSTEYKLLSTLVVFIATFCLYYYDCHKKSKNVNYKQSARLSCPVFGMSIVYVVLLYLCPLLISFPLTKLVGIVLNTYVGCIAAGIVFYSTLLATKTFAKDIMCV